ncbi:MAG TPA: 4a-hydroxytetrahydrobiopterin dehydratase [Telluria sp.]|nr:4a-hydroxytetrahydrobiopterin dehydratase [Telluria sp.]
MSLADRHCQPVVSALDAGAVGALLPQVPGWAVEGGKLVRRFGFRNYYETIAFVNALAWFTHREDHHPELTVGYKECTVSYATHSVGGALSDNDFICAAKANALYARRAGA